MPSNPLVWVNDDQNYMLLVRRALRTSGVPNPVLWVQGFEFVRSYLGGLDDKDRTYFFPCLIVVEVRPPAADALLFLSWIRARAFATVPLVLLDAQSGLDVWEAKELGATEVLAKLVEREAIQALVTRIIREWL
jgi:DNA-binding response OmpR family regulator